MCVTYMDISRIPFICKFKPGIPGISVLDPDYNYDYPDPDPPLDGEEMYSLTVALQTGSEPAQQKTIMKTREDSATVLKTVIETVLYMHLNLQVAVGDRVSVSSHINAVPYLALAMEQCWLSASPGPTSHAGSPDIKLISAGCPARLDSVSLHWDTGKNSAFSFTVSKVQSVCQSVSL